MHTFSIFTSDYFLRFFFDFHIIRLFLAKVVGLLKGKWCEFAFFSFPLVFSGK